MKMQQSGEAVLAGATTLQGMPRSCAVAFVPQPPARAAAAAAAQIQRVVPESCSFALAPTPPAAAAAPTPILQEGGPCRQAGVCAEEAEAVRGWGGRAKKPRSVAASQAGAVIAQGMPESCAFALPPKPQAAVAAAQIRRAP